MIDWGVLKLFLISNKVAYKRLFLIYKDNIVWLYIITRIITKGMIEYFMLGRLFLCSFEICCPVITGLLCSNRVDKVSSKRGFLVEEKKTEYFVNFWFFRLVYSKSC